MKLRNFNYKEIKTILNGYYKQIPPIEIVKELEDRSIASVKLVHYQYRSFMNKLNTYPASNVLVEYFEEYNNENGYKQPDTPQEEPKEEPENTRTATVNMQPEEQEEREETVSEQVTRAHHSLVAWLREGDKVVGEYVKLSAQEAVEKERAAQEEELAKLRAENETLREYKRKMKDFFREAAENSGE